MRLYAIMVFLLASIQTVADPVLMFHYVTIDEKKECNTGSDGQEKQIDSCLGVEDGNCCKNTCS